MFKLVQDRSRNGQELRGVVVQTIQDLMESNTKVVALEADLGGASKFPIFKRVIRIVLYNVVLPKPI